MVRNIDAIFTKGVFRPLEPLTLPEGTRVQLSVDDDRASVPRTAKIYSPRLAHPEQARDFVMEVREIGDASL